MAKTKVMNKMRYGQFKMEEKDYNRLIKQSRSEGFYNISEWIRFKLLSLCPKENQ